MPEPQRKSRDEHIRDADRYFAGADWEYGVQRLGRRMEWFDTRDTAERYMAAWTATFGTPARLVRRHPAGPIEPVPERPPVADDYDATVPRAMVEQIGRWTYVVYVLHGISRWGPQGDGWHAWGRGRAERKARVVLAKYLLTEKRKAERWEVGLRPPYDVIHPDGSVTHHSSPAEQRAGWAAVYTVPPRPSQVEHPR